MKCCQFVPLPKRATWTAEGEQNSCVRVSAGPSSSETIENTHMKDIPLSESTSSESILCVFSLLPGQGSSFLTQLWPLVLVSPFLENCKVRRTRRTSLPRTAANLPLRCTRWAMLAMIYILDRPLWSALPSWALLINITCTCFTKLFSTLIALFSTSWRTNGKEKRRSMARWKMLTESDLRMITDNLNEMKRAKLGRGCKELSILREFPRVRDPTGCSCATS